jgi:hypothetical protein
MFDSRLTLKYLMRKIQEKGQIHWEVSKSIIPVDAGEQAQCQPPKNWSLVTGTVLFHIHFREQHPTPVSQDLPSLCLPKRAVVISFWPAW